MIRLHRPVEPAWWRGPWRPALAAEAERFFSRPEKDRRQESFDWNRFPADQKTLAKLGKAAAGKCAYCETRLVGSTRPTLDLYRPREFAIGLLGEVDPDHYWWLAFEWTNVLCACPRCSKSKGSNFPVAHQRAPARSGGAKLSAEEPLLLNPTTDEPAEHLRFELDGSGVVAPRSRRGQETIRLLELNRPELKSARAEAQREAEGLWDNLVRYSQRQSGGLGVAVLEGLAGELPHAAVRRELIALRLDDHLELRELLTYSRRWRSEILPLLQPYLAERPKTSPAPAPTVAHQALSVQLPKEAAPAGEPGYLARIEVEDFRGIERLSLSFEFESQAPSALAPWLMLLGENGVGKSSVLQAVALGLAPAPLRRRLVAQPAQLVRRGATTGRAAVRLAFSSGQQVELEIDGSSGRMRGTSPPLLLCAYGSTRLIPDAVHAPSATKGRVHASTLFDPFRPLLDPQSWLLGSAAEKRSRFDYAVRSIKGILDLASGVRFEPSRQGDTVEVHEGARPPVELGQLSDGYRSMLALTVDLIARLGEHCEVVEAAQGLVLVDELGLHMHPRWRMRVVAGLRRAFPRLEFLCTTHDPLCLRGLYRGEVAVMRRDEDGKIVALTEGLPDVAALRVDQLLTSEYFGLQTAMDPETEARFAAYYELLGLHAPTPEQAARLVAIKAELAGKELLGSSERERLMYGAIDRFLAQKAALGSDAARAALPSMEADLRVELQRIWDES